MKHHTATVATMIESTKANHIIRSGDESTLKYCREVLQKTKCVTEVADMPVFEDLFPHGTSLNSEEYLPPIPPNTIDLDWPAVLNHTSGGSTLNRFELC